MTFEIDCDDWKAKIVALELASETGKRIIRLLLGKSISANQIASQLKLPLTTVFYHLSRLELVDLVESKVRFTDRGPRWIKYYKASSSKITFNLEGGE